MAILATLVSTCEGVCIHLLARWTVDKCAAAADGDGDNDDDDENHEALSGTLYVWT